MEKKIGNIFKGDKGIWMVFLFLCMISVVEVFSASSNLTYKSNSYIMPMIKHSGTLIFGLVVAIGVLNIPCRYFKLAILPLIGVSVATLLWVLFAGEKINGAQRVIDLFGLTFQPSEIAKGTVILAVAQILSATQTDEGTAKYACKWILIVTVPLAFLIMVENLSTAILLCTVVFLMMFIGRVPSIQLGKILGFVLLLGALVFGSVMLFGHDKRGENPELTKTESMEKPKEQNAITKLFHRFDTWKTRIYEFSDSKPVPPSEFDLDKKAQVAHANIAIVSSHVIGKGPGNSEERDFLPQAFSDFIYSIIIEETGIFGAFGVVFLYTVLLFRTARIASRCENNFPAFLAMGLTLMLVVQATFNMLVAVGFAPVTGQPLPLISKGGTSTVINCAYIGALLSVSRSARKKPEASDEPADDAQAA